MADDRFTGHAHTHTHTNTQTHTPTRVLTHAQQLNTQCMHKSNNACQHSNTNSHTEWLITHLVHYVKDTAGLQSLTPNLKVCSMHGCLFKTRPILQMQATDLQENRMKTKWSTFFGLLLCASTKMSDDSAGISRKNIEVRSHELRTSSSSTSSSTGYGSSRGTSSWSSRAIVRSTQSMMKKHCRMH